MLSAKPITFKAACAFVAALHRHHKPPRGHKFSIGVEAEGKLVGVVMVGRPVARGLDNGFTAEVIRLCTDGTPNACSFLYGASARAAQAMGYRKIVTYILGSEGGTSLRATGWVKEAETGGGSWSCTSRPREDKHPLEPKSRYARVLGAA